MAASSHGPPRAEHESNLWTPRATSMTPAGGDMLVVLKRRRGMDVFKIDSAGNVVERVKSIGSQALFLGVRCLVVDTDCFPTVEPNFELTDRGMDQYQCYIGIYDEEQEPEMVSAAIFHEDDLRPLTLMQLLSNYTMDIPSQPLTWRMQSNYFGGDHYDDYIDHVDDEPDDTFLPYFEDYWEYM